MKSDIDEIIKDLEAALQKSEAFIKEPSQSHAFIIGHLQGTIKGTIENLKYHQNEKSI